jgi:hypothetical protein
VVSQVSRAAAIAELFEGLEGLIERYAALSETDRRLQWDVDADRITGEVARCLGAARTRLPAAHRW